MPIEFSCTSAHYGTTTQVTVIASSRHRQITRLPLDVRCLSPQRQIAVPAVAPLAAVALVPPPAPGPGQPNVNPQINPQAQTNPGFAAAEEQEPQLAMAEGDLAEDDGTTSLEMSALRRDDPAGPALFVVTAALMTAAAAGCCLRVARRNNWGGQRS